MKLFYGWVIVGAGIVVTCVGFGAMLSLSIFLQPMAEAMGWSRTGISTAATIPNLRLLRLAGAGPLEGGIPLMVDDKIVGAVGVSGAASERDAQVAKAGVEALGNKRARGGLV